MLAAAVIVLLNETAALVIAQLDTFVDLVDLVDVAASTHGYKIIGVAWRIGDITLLDRWHAKADFGLEHTANFLALPLIFTCVGGGDGARWLTNAANWLWRVGNGGQISDRCPLSLRSPAVLGIVAGINVGFGALWFATADHSRRWWWLRGRRLRAAAMLNCPLFLDAIAHRLNCTRLNAGIDSAIPCASHNPLAVPDPLAGTPALAALFRPFVARRFTIVLCRAWRRP